MSSEQEPATPPVQLSSVQTHWPILLSWVILASSLAVGPWSVQGVSKLWVLLLHITTGIPLFKITHRFGSHDIGSGSARNYWIVAAAWWVAFGICIQLPNAGSLLTWVGALVWTSCAGVATFRRVPAKPSVAPSVAPHEPYSSSSGVLSPGTQTPSTDPNALSSRQRWPITLALLCLVLSLGNRLLWNGQDAFSEAADIESSALNLVAYFGWVSAVVTQTGGEIVLFFITRRFGSRALSSGSARPAWGVALAWLVITVAFFRIQPATCLPLAPAALVWIGVAATIRPGYSSVSPIVSPNDTAS